MNASAREEKRGEGVPPKRAFTTARIVALVVIGLVVLALGYVHVSSGDDTVSVPSGAKAGDLILDDCRYATEQGSYDADCGTLVVPENRHRADSRLIALPVTRIRARSADPAEPIFRLQGGPGITNMTFPAASRFADDHDVVLVGYRGVDGSSARLPRGRRRRSSSSRPPRARRRCVPTRRRSGTARSASRTTASTSPATRFPSGSTTSRRRAARSATSASTSLSESAGTRTAMIYAWRYPKRIHRSVMIGANPPGNFLWDARTTDEQIGRYAALCANDASCRSRHAGSRRLDSLGLRRHAGPLVVPADQDGQRPARRLLRV